MAERSKEMKKNVTEGNKTLNAGVIWRKLIRSERQNQFRCPKVSSPTDPYTRAEVLVSCEPTVSQSPKARRNSLIDEFKRCNHV